MDLQLNGLIRNLRHDLDELVFILAGLSFGAAIVDHGLGICGQAVLPVDQGLRHGGAGTLRLFLRDAQVFRLRLTDRFKHGGNTGRALGDFTFGLRLIGHA